MSFSKEFQNEMKILLRRTVLFSMALLMGGFAVVASGAAKSEVDYTASKLDRPALKLEVGESDKLSYKGGKTEITWSSSDESIVTVDSEGNVKAIAAGEADITASGNNVNEVCHITVVAEKTNFFKENIIISNFWPPIGPNYITREQYEWMAEAGINYVMGAGENVGEKESQLKMLQWCEELGMKMMVGDDRTGRDMRYWGNDQLDALLDEYRNIPAVEGYHLCDEPPVPAEFHNIYRMLKMRNPNANVYFNFYPYESDEGWFEVDDWLRYCAGIGYPSDYYMYDVYNIFNTGTNYYRQLNLLYNAWKISRKNNNVPLATFALTTKHLVYKQPNEAHLRWQVNTSLAFGSKYICYFTWFCPKNADNAYTGAIIGSDGKKTELYDGVSRVNHETLAIGSTLVKLVPYDVRVNGSRFTDIKLGGSFPVKSTGKEEYIVTLMRNDETRRNYLFFVYNDSDKDGSIKVDLDQSITSLKLVDNGTDQKYTFDNGTLTLEAIPGEAFLFELPEGLDFVPTPAEPEDGDNLVKYAYVTANESTGNYTYNIGNLADGNRFTNSVCGGWLVEGLVRKNANINVNIDFGTGDYVGKTRSFDRVDIFPMGRGVYFGQHMPKAFEIQISDDGENWTTVASVSDYKQDGYKACTVKFDRQSARMLRIHMTQTDGALGFCEVEVYDTTKADVPPAPEFDAATVPNTNLALNAKVSATSSQEEYGWSINCINDGATIYSDANGSNGYCSATSGLCDVVFDLAVEQYINEFVMYPALDPYGSPYYTRMPMNFTIDMSKDGKKWTTVYADENYKQKDKKPTTIEFDTVNARFVRLHMISTDLPEVCMAEIEFYYRPEKAVKPIIELETELVTERETEARTEPATQTDVNETTDELVTEDENKTPEEPKKALGVGAVVGIAAGAAAAAAGVIYAVSKKKKK